MPPVNSAESSALLWDLDQLIVDDQLRNSRMINDHQNVENHTVESNDLIPTTVIEKEEETAINRSVSYCQTSGLKKMWNGVQSSFSKMSFLCFLTNIIACTMSDLTALYAYI
jgi:hypothetical protein